MFRHTIQWQNSDDINPEPSFDVCDANGFKVSDETIHRVIICTDKIEDDIESKDDVKNIVDIFEHLIIIFNKTDIIRC